MGKRWQEVYNQYKNLFWKNYNYYKEKESFKNFIELVLTSLAIVVFSVFALKPTANTIIEINKEIKAKKETLSKMNIKIKNLQKAQILLSQEQESFALLDKSLPSQPDPEIVIRQLEAASNDSGVEIKSISTKDIVLSGNPNTGNTKKVPENSSYFGTSIAITGQYENLIKAMQTYENLLRTLTIDQVSLQPDKTTETKTGTMNLSITAGALYFTERKNEQPTKKETTQDDLEMVKTKK